MNLPTQSVFPPLPISIRVDGIVVPSITSFTNTGAHVLTIATVVAEHGVEFVSTYAGVQGLSESSAQHVALLPGLQRTWGRSLDARDVPVWYRRRACLYDHLQQLVAASAAAAVEIGAVVDDAAVAALEAAV